MGGLAVAGCGGLLCRIVQAGIHLRQTYIQPQAPDLGASGIRHVPRLNFQLPNPNAQCYTTRRIALFSSIFHSLFHSLLPIRTIFHLYRLYHNRSAACVRFASVADHHR